MTTLNEGRHTAEFIVSEANGHRSREQVTIGDSGAVLSAGLVLGIVGVGSATSEAGAGNTGDGTMGAITVADPAKAGDYSVTFIETATDGGDFIVEDPDGVQVGTGSVGSEFSAGGLTFTISDGGTDFASSDTFIITVAEGDGDYVPHDPDADNGSQNAAAILYGEVDANGQDAAGTIIARDVEVDEGALTWADGITTGQKDAAKAALARKGIQVR